MKRISKLIKEQKGMAMIIVLTVAFVVLITVGAAAAIIANNLDRSGGQVARGVLDNNLSLAMERLRGMYKVNSALLKACQSSETGECIDLVNSVCVSCSDPAATYSQGSVDYKILINKITQPAGLNVGFADLLLTSVYKNISKQKTVRMCLNYCDANSFNCGDNGCGGSCGSCTEPQTCKENKCTASGTVPGAPTIDSATAGNAQAAISFFPPIDDGGSPITSYTVTSSPESITGTGGSSPITVTGLTNGIAYSFTVTATNAIGTGPASAASKEVTPGAVPGAPTGLAAAYNNMSRTITLTWLAPGVGIGEPAITNYRIYHGTTSNGEAYIDIVGNVLTYVDAKNVKVGLHYYKVTAVNAIGESVYSNEASVNVK